MAEVAELPAALQRANSSQAWPSDTTGLPSSLLILKGWSCTYLPVLKGKASIHPFLTSLPHKAISNSRRITQQLPPQPLQIHTQHRVASRQRGYGDFQENEAVAPKQAGEKRGWITKTRTSHQVEIQHPR